MRESGLKTQDQARDMNNMRMGISTRVSIKEVNHMGRESIDGVLRRSMRGSGIKDSSMVMEYGEELLAIHILANGVTQKQKDTVSTYGKTVIDLRDSGRVSSSMARAVTSSVMGMYT